MTNEKQDMIMITPAFEEIRKMQDYLPAVQGVLVGADVTSIKMLHDINKILTAKNANELSHILHYEICSATAKQIGFTGGYRGELSKSKLKGWLEQISKAYIDQARLSADDLRKVCKKQEAAIFNQESEKIALNDKINELLEMAQNFASRASDKARITAQKTKKDFEKARAVIMNILNRRYGNREDPEDVDVQKLQRVSYGQKEEYFR